METEQNSRVGAVVLAAGKSRRMGRPKQLLELHERPLLEHVLANLRAANVSDIVVVLGFVQDEIRRRVDFHQAKIVENVDYEKGMASSLRAGLSSLDNEVTAALIVLADQPFVLPQTYSQIIARHRQCASQIVIPIYQGFRGNPVLLHRSVFPEVMALDGDIGCRAIFGGHSEGIVKARVDDLGILLDIDSEEDFARLKGYRRTGDEQDVWLNAVDLDGRIVLQSDKPTPGQEVLIIVGSEPVAFAMARLGKLLQFRVVVIDPLLRSSELPEADTVLNALDLSPFAEDSRRYVVIASRGRFDEEAIEQALAADVRYIGLVANRKRAAEVRHRLESSGLKLDNLRAPAGLDIGAATPEEVALSILAEIVAFKRKSNENQRPVSG